MCKGEGHTTSVPRGVTEAFLPSPLPVPCTALIHAIEQQKNQSPPKISSLSLLCPSFRLINPNQARPSQVDLGGGQSLLVPSPQSWLPLPPEGEGHRLPAAGSWKEPCIDEVQCSPPASGKALLSLSLPHSGLVQPPAALSLSCPF